MQIDTTTLTISSALAHMRAGDYSALALVEACLKRVADLNSRLNAFITPTPELAVQAALAADSIYQLNPPNLMQIALLGIPVAFKDLFETAGVRTTAGSRFFADDIPQGDAEAVLRIKMAGACMVGKTNTHEIALGVTGMNPHFGDVKNPRNPDHIAGGSSSGSAAALVAGMCLAALGTDTGGSIRIPASLCGLVGLKPTLGRISRRGVIPLSWNLDHVGTLTHNVKDAGILLNVLAGYDPHDPGSTSQPVDDYVHELETGVAGRNIALAAGKYIETSETAILAGVEKVGRILSGLGASVGRVDVSWLADLAQANTRMTQADAAAFHRGRLENQPDLFGADVRQRLELGARLSATDYALARRTQSEGQRRVEEFFSRHQILILPTTPITAPRLEAAEALEAARVLTRFTSPFNLTGLPAITIPCGEIGGLPFGVQLVAGYWEERSLLQAAHACEKVISAGN